jgi:DNA-binding MarR family transcriptional regulator
MSEQQGQIRLVTGILRVAFLVNTAYAKAGREMKVTPQQGQLLSLLRPKPYGMGELNAKLGLAKSTTTGLVEILERDGLVKRQAGTPTGRSVQVDLTRTGRKVADRFYAAINQRIEEMLEPLDTSERESIRALIERVVDRDDLSMTFVDADEMSAATTRS